MINTVIYKTDFGLGCHSVGLLGCVSIIETSIGLDSYSYKAVYESGVEVQIEDVILATDQKLA